MSAPVQCRRRNHATYLGLLSCKRPSPLYQIPAEEILKVMRTLPPALLTCAQMQGVHVHYGHGGTWETALFPLQTISTLF